MSFLTSRFRELAKNQVLAGAEQTLLSDQGRQIVLSAARPLAQASPLELGLELGEQPYDGMVLPGRSAASERGDVVIITARFRTGSTLLWNLFRNLPGVTAYYEPFNERRWFDPAARGTHIDRTHRQVDEYWREYDGLAELGEWYDEDWIRRDLYMDANYWAPRMKRYVEIMIERAAGRPVLQFNRIDFRLPWFRRQFPHAKLVHLYRHPRDQWLSSLGDGSACGPDGTVAQFARCDRYYLLGWANDLATHFPMLRLEPQRHPYELFYLIWRLSYMFGRRFAGYSLSFERLLAEPQPQLEELLDRVGIANADLDRLQKLLSPPVLGKWRSYADEAWFLRVEERCEMQLGELFGNESLESAGVKVGV